jgi:eukaryotic-like serine/threonine-protein kinase
VTVLAAGHRIAGRYQLDRRIAVGGMGEVWEAEDIRLGRNVAVKVLRPELSDDPEFLHRFRIEARTVASLDHSGIAAVHDYGEDDGPIGDARTAYLVMELVRGEPLSSLIARGPLDAGQTLRIMEQASRALQAAHERGYVHRDVKPGNILIRVDGKVKLTDFGIAKAADAVPVTRSGMVMGTAHYIAPEQASGAEAGPSGDVYSLGIVGYECLAGHRPFRAESAVAVAMMQVREPPPPLPQHVPPAVRELIEAVLVKNPEQRYSTGGELAVAVAAVRRGHPRPLPGDPLLTNGLTPAAVDDTGETVYATSVTPSPTSGPLAAGPTSGPLASGASSGPVAAGPASGPVAAGPSSGPVPAGPTSGPLPAGSTSGPLPAGSTSGPLPAQPTSGPIRSGPTSGPVASPAARDDVALTSPPGVTGPDAPDAGADSRAGADTGADTGANTTVGSVPGMRAVVPAPPTEPIRIQPARGNGPGLLLVLFILLTLAAVALGVFLLRGGFGDTARGAAAPTPAAHTVAGSVAARDAAAPLDSPRNLLP